MDGDGGGVDDENDVRGQLQQGKRRQQQPAKGYDEDPQQQRRRRRQLEETWVPVFI